MCERLFVVKWSWQCTWVSCTQRYITVRQSHLGSCACCHEDARARKQLLCLFPCSTPEIYANTRRPDRRPGGRGLLRVPGHWGSSAQDRLEQERQESQQPEIWGMALICCWSVTCYLLFMQFLNVLKYCKLYWKGFSSFHFMPEQGLIECSD